MAGIGQHHHKCLINKRIHENLTPYPQPWITPFLISLYTTIYLKSTHDFALIQGSIHLEFSSPLGYGGA
jgi:hypothetical protein